MAFYPNLKSKQTYLFLTWKKRKLPVKLFDYVDSQ